MNHLARLAAVVALVAAIAVPRVASAAEFVVSRTLADAQPTPDLLDPQDDFGRRIAIDGDLMAVGSPGDAGGAGAVHLYEFDGRWRLRGSLSAPPDEAGRGFGTSVDVDGDRVIVGFGNRPTNSNPPIAAYVFARSGSDWRPDATLIAPDGARNDFRLGLSVAISGDRALVAAPITRFVHAYHRDADGWRLEQSLEALDFTGVSLALALDGDTAVVGTPFELFDNRAGRVRVYAHHDGGWSLHQELIPSTTGSPVQSLLSFGFALSLDSDRLVVGAPQASIGGAFHHGAAVVFDRQDDGRWQQSQPPLYDAAGVAGDGFGSRVAIHGDAVAIVAPLAASPSDPQSRQGTVIVFRHDPFGWNPDARFWPATDAGSQGAWINYGASVALHRDFLMIGAPGNDLVSPSDRAPQERVVDAGGVEMIPLTTGFPRGWLQLPDGADEDRFGAALALQGDTALVAAPGVMHEGVAHLGSVRVYRRTGAEWELASRLGPAPDAPARGGFGLALALRGDLALVGAPHEPSGSGQDDGGAVYVFRRQGDDWTLQRRIGVDEVSSRAAKSVYAPRFGSSIAFDRDATRVLVGAPGAYAGSVFALEQIDGDWSVMERIGVPDGGAGDGTDFGHSLLVLGETLLVGAPGASTHDIGGRGAVYAFARTDDGWQSYTRIIDPDATSDAGFGHALLDAGSEPGSRTAIATAPRANADGRSQLGTALQLRLFDDGSVATRALVPASALTSHDRLGVAATVITPDLWLLTRPGPLTPGSPAQGSGRLMQLVREDGRIEHRPVEGLPADRWREFGLAVAGMRDPGTNDLEAWVSARAPLGHDGAPGGVDILRAPDASWNGFRDGFE